MLLSSNVQSEHVATEESVQTSILLKQTFYAFVGQCYFHVTSNLNMSQQGKVFKERYYWNLKTLSRCRPVLISGNVEPEHVAAGEMFQTTILSEH